MKSIRTCLYIKTNGEVCNSPALRRRGYCYFHHEAAKRNQRRTRLGNAQSLNVDFPEFDDAEAIQVGISEVAFALLDRRLDPRQATTLLYAMQLAISNLKNLHNAPRKFHPSTLDVPPFDEFNDDILDDDQIAAAERDPDEDDEDEHDEHASDASGSCADCPDTSACDTCEHFEDDSGQLKFPPEKSLTVAPPPSPVHQHTRKPPKSAPDLATINRDLQAATRGDRQALARLAALQDPDLKNSGLE